MGYTTLPSEDRLGIPHVADSYTALGTAGSGFLGVGDQSVAPGTPASGIRLYAVSGKLSSTSSWGTGLFGLFANGSAAVPSIAFFNEGDMGFYRVSAGLLGFAVGGSNSLQFATGGVIYGPGGVSYLTIAGAGAISLTCGGSNQSITLTPSGTGQTLLGGGGTTVRGGVDGGAYTCTKFMKATTAIANATPAAVLTITVPNAENRASIKVRIIGALGAGGAIGAGEASGTVAYDISIVRTTGVNAVATISSAYGSGMANVAGGATITVTAAMSAVSGAVGVTNTFTVNVTISRGSGSSTNHTCLLIAESLNVLGSGITLS